MEVYKLDESNFQQYLYYAASNYHNGDELDKALAGYSKLLDSGYTGVETQYYAVEKETGENQLFGDEAERSIMLKAGTNTDQKEVMTKNVKAQKIQKKTKNYHNKK